MKHETMLYQCPTYVMLNPTYVPLRLHMTRVNICLLQCLVCSCLSLVVKSSDSGLAESCASLLRHIPFTPANNIGRDPVGKKNENTTTGIFNII